MKITFNHFWLMADLLSNRWWFWNNVISSVQLCCVVYLMGCVYVFLLSANRPSQYENTYRLRSVVVTPMPYYCLGFFVWLVFSVVEFCLTPDALNQIVEYPSVGLPWLFRLWWTLYSQHCTSKNVHSGRKQAVMVIYRALRLINVRL